MITCTACDGLARAHEQQPDAASRVRLPTAFVRGVIDDAKAAAIERAAVAPGIAGIQIDSLGGSETAAIRIAHVVRTHRLPVTVDGMCFSACSQYILAASRNVTLRPGSLVAFHTSSYALNVWSRSHLSSGRSYAKVFERTEPVAAQTASLLSTQPARLRALTASFSALAPLCLEPIPDTDPRAPRVRVRYDFWVPDAEFMGALGYQVPPTWPVTRAEVEQRIAQRLPRAEFAYGPPQPAFTRGLGSCPAGLK
jgi:hypothetical protein